RYAAYGALGGAALALVALVARNRRGLATLALLLSLAAFLPPWMMQRSARSKPPIHDITTDTENPPPFVAVAPLRRDASNPAEYGGAEVGAQQREGLPHLTRPGP